ncbi:glycoside hydrolase family 3 N-terminal domain-containing protein [Niveibacterium sp. SC-1]|uniref:glycoside hydrolase family 3 N-terminal domain-containing protein n=1 Tax=Niveibacterium sp. SC-1 TaxID=3135646 RepID=UPI00311FB016
MTPYRNPSLPVEDRVADLLGQMTLAEKVGQLKSAWLVLEADGRHRPRVDAFAGGSDTANVPAMLADGLGQITRPLGTRPVDALEGVRALNNLQRFLREETRLGIPALAHEECLVGLMAQGATLFPSALAFGATWNPSLIERAAEVIGAEARSVGCRQGLAPVLDVSRDVRWGRTEETFGEDPYMVGVMATRYTRGLQQPDRSLLATLKHYVGHSASEGARNHAPVNLGWRELNDTYLLPFEMAVKGANAGSVMPAYHDIDGEPCHASHHLLTEVLRNRWGFDGIVVADYIGINLLHEHHRVARTPTEAAALAFAAGLDIELPGDDCARTLMSAVEEGLISVSQIDEAVRRVLREKFRLGLFENPYVSENAIALQAPETVAVARDTAREAVVLLENNGVLPLNRHCGLRIAVIGPTADDPLAMLSGYSFPTHLILSSMDAATSQIVTPLAAIRDAFRDGEVLFEKGCDIIAKRQAGAPVFPGDVADAAVASGQSQISTDTSRIEAAVRCAKSADVVVLCVGDLAGLFQTGTVGEGSDADSLRLPGVQEELLRAVVDCGTPVVAVLTGGRPYLLGGYESKVAALVWSFAGGQEGGHALAEVLSGVASPSGRLPVSVPKSVGALPYFYNHKLKSAGTPIAFHFGSRYPFGHGLTYTSFRFEKGDDTEPVISNDDQSVVTVSVRITNTGEVAGVAVPQLYVRDLHASSVRPVRELKAFDKVGLAPGESAVVTFSVPTDLLCFTGVTGQRIVESGEFEFQIGESSAEIQFRKTVRVEGETRVLPKRWRMFSTSSVLRLQ